MTGKFVVIEGLEGAGKSTAISLVKSRIEQSGHKVVCTREPGGTPMAEAIRECVKQDWKNETVTVEAELMLMYAARAQLLSNVIQPNLECGNWVLGDRHDMSSRAYQGGGRQIPDDVIDPLRRITLKNCRPDLTLYMDVEPKTGLARARGRGELDRIEMEDISFFQRTRNKYLELAETEANVVVINTMQEIEQVHRALKIAIDQFLENQ